MLWFFVLRFKIRCFFAAFSSAICWRNKQQQQRQQQHRTPFVCRCVCKHAMCGTSIVGCLCTAARTCNSCTILFFFFASFCCSLNERAQSEHLINSRFCFEDYFAGDTGPKTKSKWQRHSKLFTYFTITLNIPSKIYRIFAVQLLANGHMLFIPLVFLVFFMNCYWFMIVFKIRLFCWCKWFTHCIYICAAIINNSHIVIFHAKFNNRWQLFYMCMFWVYDRFIEDIDNKKIVKSPIDYAADNPYSSPGSVNNWSNWVHGILLLWDVGQTFVNKFLRSNFSNSNALSYYYLSFYYYLLLLRIFVGYNI